MAISKRTRFEVLRRDDFTCRYCRSKDHELTVDHVVPVALGGTDKPDNLVAACRDCNAGKSSTSPDAALVSDVEADAVRWAAARKVAAAKLRAHDERHREFLNDFYRDWTRWNKDACWLPDGWESSIRRWLDAGLTEDQVDAAYSLALSKSHVGVSHVFRYMAGILKNKLIELDEATAAELRREAAE